MSNFSNDYLSVLHTALIRLAGDFATYGEVVFIKDLETGLPQALAQQHQKFNVGRWDVYAVSDRAEGNVITVDRAVELREEKGTPLILLIDPVRAGAGRDGIFSAGREIRAQALFEMSIGLAELPLVNDSGYLSKAERTAASLFSSHVRRGAASLSARQRFDFRIRAAVHKGHALAALGLWPSDSPGKVDIEEIEISAGMVRRLFDPNELGTPEELVGRLLLSEEDNSQSTELCTFLRKWKPRGLSLAMNALTEIPSLLLGNLRPEFASERPKKLHWETWQKRTNGIHSWSGLQDRADEKPSLILNRDDSKKSAKLQVRWRTDPEDLPAQAANYQVTIECNGQILAATQVEHRSQAVQRATFSVDDFDDVEEGSYEARIIISTQTGSDDEESSQSLCHPIETPEFMIEFGEITRGQRITAGRFRRALSEALIEADTREKFEEVCELAKASIIVDPNGYLASSSKSISSFRIPRPELIALLERDWEMAKSMVKTSIVRWSIKVRNDGTMADKSLTPHAILDITQETEKLVKLQSAAEKLAKSVRQYSKLDGAGLSLLARVLDRDRHKEVDGFLKAWRDCADQPDTPASIGLINTITIENLAGEPVGLIVPPHHPARLAWLQAYDEAIIRARYEEDVEAKDVLRDFSHLNSAMFPAFLPGFEPGEGRGFTFADVSWFHSAIMLPSGDAEPRASLALVTKALEAETSQPIKLSAAEAISKGIGLRLKSYLDCRREEGSDIGEGLDCLDIIVSGSGDGRIMADALGSFSQAKPEDRSNINGSVSQVPEELLNLRFDLTFLERSSNRIAGSFLSSVSDRRRSGSGATAEYKWITESVQNGGVSMPRLRWRIHSEGSTNSKKYGHVAVIFDSTAANILSAEMPAPSNATVGEGLAQSIVVFTRQPEIFEDGGATVLPMAGSGQLAKTQNLCAQLAGRSGGGDWPYLASKGDAETSDELNTIEERTDWQIRIDRGLRAPVTFDLSSYHIVDSSAPNQSLGGYGITATTRDLSDVTRALNQGIGDLGLSSNIATNQKLFQCLSAASSRMALLLLSASHLRGEMISAAMLYDWCRDRADWAPDLRNEVLIPVAELGDHPAFWSKQSQPETYDADLLGQNVIPNAFIRIRIVNKQIQLGFFQVELQRHASSASSISSIEVAAKKLVAVRERLRLYFEGARKTSLGKNLGGFELKQLVEHYRQRAQQAGTFNPELGLDDLGSKLIERALLDHMKFGHASPMIWNEDVEVFVFMPEKTDTNLDPLPTFKVGDASIITFGPREAFFGVPSHVSLDTQRANPLADNTNDLDALVVPVVDAVTDNPDSGTDLSESLVAPRLQNELVNVVGRDEKVTENELEPSKDISPVQAANRQSRDSNAQPNTASDHASILIGTSPLSGNQFWRVSTKTNPHLMIAGLPGMGKTNTLVSICSQLIAQDIVPIVFSFHDDLDEDLEKIRPNARYIDLDDLGFDPMLPANSGRRAHIDVAGDIRDIFASVFPDLGDVQRAELRESIVESYTNAGWQPDSDVGKNCPKFGDFLEVLKSRSKPNQGLLARLAELSDYGFFEDIETSLNILDSKELTLIRLHKCQSQGLQDAFAAFTFYRIYKEMFQRGRSTTITHAIIFDEAHRASGLSLLSTMAKESRKFGLSLIVGSQEVSDFNKELFGAILNYLIPRVNDRTARHVASLVATSKDKNRIMDALKELPKYQALFFGETETKPTAIKLLPKPDVSG